MREPEKVRPAADGKGSLRRKIVVVACVAALVYAASYLGLSRYSRSVMREVGGHGFYYVPCSIDCLAKHESLQTLHYGLIVVYYPIWALDYYVLGGPPYACIPLLSLGSPEEPPPQPVDGP